MAVPFRRTSKLRKRTRRSHHALSTPNVALCKNCSQPIHGHSACMNCGFYKDKAVMEVKDADK